MPDFQLIFKNKLVGITGKGTHIYTTTDPADENARVIIFRKTQISKVNIQLDIQVKDLYKEEEERYKIIKQKPNWLNNDHGNKEKEDHLCRCALIQMSGEFSFSIAEKASILLENVI